MSRNLEKGFLDDIVANIDDDTPRLVYADWLDEHGQPERAELIRVQIERARLPKWDAAQVRLRVREEALIQKNGKQWKRGLPSIKGVEWGGFRRGFVAEATLTSFALLREAGWREAVPIEAVSVRWPKKGETDAISPVAGLRELSLAGRQLVAHADAERLAVSPLLSTLRVLDVTGCALGLDGLGRVLSSPHLGRLKAVRAGDNTIGDGVAAALAAAPALGSLEELDLSESGDAGYYGEEVFTAEGMAELGAWPGLARVRRLDLSGHDCRRNQLSSLLRSPLLTGLKELILHNTHNYGGWGELLHDAPPGMRLDLLDVGENAFRQDGSSFAANPRLGGLKVLRVDDVFDPESADDLRALVSGRFMSSLRVLTLEGGEADSSGLQPLIDAAPPLLHTLVMRDAYFQGSELIAFARSPASDTVLELDLTGSELGRGAAEALGASDHLRDLLVLRVGGNRPYQKALSEKEMDALAASPLGQRLLLLDREPGR